MRAARSAAGMKPLRQRTEIKHRGQVFILDIYYRRESSVSQASRRVAQRIEKDKKLKKKIDKIEKKLNV